MTRPSSSGQLELIGVRKQTKEEKKNNTKFAACVAIRLARPDLECCEILYTQVHAAAPHVNTQAIFAACYDIRPHPSAHPLACRVAEENLRKSSNRIGRELDETFSGFLCPKQLAMNL